MENTVLLIVDMQEGLLKRHPYREEQLLSNITSLAGTARETALKSFISGTTAEKALLWKKERRTGKYANRCIPGKTTAFLIKILTAHLKKPG